MVPVGFGVTHAVPAVIETSSISTFPVVLVTYINCTYLVVDNNVFVSTIQEAPEIVAYTDTSVYVEPSDDSCTLKFPFVGLLPFKEYVN